MSDRNPKGQFQIGNRIGIKPITCPCCGKGIRVRVYVSEAVEGKENPAKDGVCCDNNEVCD